MITEFETETTAAAKQLEAAAKARVHLTKDCESYLLQARMDLCPYTHQDRLVCESYDEGVLRTRLLAEAWFYEKVQSRNGRTQRLVHGNILGLDYISGLRNDKEKVVVIFQGHSCARPRAYEISGNLNWPDKHWVLFRPASPPVRAALHLNVRGHVATITLAEPLDDGLTHADLLRAVREAL